MAPEDLEKLLSFFKTLADGSRLRLLGILANHERTVGELADLLDLREPTVSHHLAKLKAMGLVASRAEGTSRVYRLNVDGLAELRGDLLVPEKMARWVPDVGPEAWERKVLGAFVETDEGRERLTRIPASRKKRDVILRWLVEKFDRGVDYPEPEVNARIKPYHSDFATLRRELVGARLMTREAGIYRRTEAQAQ